MTSNNNPLTGSAFHSHDFHRYFHRNPAHGIERTTSITSQASFAQSGGLLDEWINPSFLRSPGLSTFGSPSQPTFPTGTNFEPPTPTEGCGEYPTPFLLGSGSDLETQRWISSVQPPNPQLNWSLSRQPSLVEPRLDRTGVQAMCRSLFPHTEEDHEEENDEEFDQRAEDEQAVQLTFLRDAARTAGEDPSLWNVPPSAACSVASFATSASSSCSTEGEEVTPPATPYANGFLAIQRTGSAVLRTSPLRNGLVAHPTIISGQNGGLSRSGSQHLQVPQSSAAREFSPSVSHYGSTTMGAEIACEWQDPFGGVRCSHRFPSANHLACHLRQVHGRQELRYLSEHRIRQDACLALILCTVFRLLHMVATSQTLKIQAVLVLQSLSSGDDVRLQELEDFGQEISRTAHELESQVAH
ncbi:hypothetical protein FRB94_009972 [Tulasnella sp. JGI-2019a]|nr:hypothetical protein FRB93_006446 [Tulasnella sp. JGI-2019a]KAG8994291.1 hypothetical protein FRB94_009972 [Tulasnella sp. JGI-2019a]KAG9026778.1 hypothetical protein FRB95_008487 [Tulasnella sp. JGI-2019a]